MNSEEKEFSDAQGDWVKITADLRKGLLKRVGDFAKGGGNYLDADSLKIFISGIGEVLEIDILANAFDRAVKNRIEPIKPPEPGEEWKGD